MWPIQNRHFQGFLGSRCSSGYLFSLFLPVQSSATWGKLSKMADGQQYWDDIKANWSEIFQKQINHFQQSNPHTKYEHCVPCWQKILNVKRFLRDQTKINSYFYCEHILGYWTFLVDLLLLQNRYMGGGASLFCADCFVTSKILWKNSIRMILVAEHWRLCTRGGAALSSLSRACWCCLRAVRLLTHI